MGEYNTNDVSFMTYRTSFFRDPKPPKMLPKDVEATIEATISILSGGGGEDAEEIDEDYYAERDDDDNNTKNVATRRSHRTTRHATVEDYSKEIDEIISDGKYTLLLANGVLTRVR